MSMSASGSVLSRRKRAHDDVEPGQCRDDPQRDPLIQAALGVAVGGVLQADERVVRPDEHEADADGGRDRQGNDPCAPVEPPMDDDGAEHDDRPHAGERMRQRHGREARRDDREPGDGARVVVAQQGPADDQREPGGEHRGIRQPEPDRVEVEQAAPPPRIEAPTDQGGEERPERDPAPAGQRRSRTARTRRGTGRDWQWLPSGAR